MPYATPEEKRAYMRRFYQRNKERLKDNSRAYYHENKEECLAYNRLWAEQNKERRRAQRAAWYQENRARLKADYDNLGEKARERREKMGREWKARNKAKIKATLMRSRYKQRYGEFWEAAIASRSLLKAARAALLTEKT